MPNLDGSCLCGNVTYGCSADPMATAVCHCTDCQKQSGTAFSIMVAVPRDALRVEGETVASVTTVGEDSRAAAQRMFCSACGSPLVTYADAMPEIALIKAGTLADTSWLAPQVEVWCDSAQPWVSIGEVAASHPRGLGT